MPLPIIQSVSLQISLSNVFSDNALFGVVWQADEGTLYDFSSVTVITSAHCSAQVITDDINRIKQSHSYSEIHWSSDLWHSLLELNLTMELHKSKGDDVGLEFMFMI